MNPQTFFTLIVVVLFVYGYWETNRKRNKILVYYSGVDGTVEDKWVNEDSGNVVLRNKKFRIIKDRERSFWLRKGIHFFFPTKVNCLFYSWYSEYPHDPNDYRNVWVTPEVRKAINKAEWVESYYKGARPSSSKKQSTIMQWIPFVAILIVFILGFWVFNNLSMISDQFADMNNKINALTP